MEAVRFGDLEFEKIIRLLADLKGQCKPTDNWFSVWDNLAGFSKKLGYEVIRSHVLWQSTQKDGRGAGGVIGPKDKVIVIQVLDIKEMVQNLAHELGHAICLRCGAISQYNNEEAARFLGGVIVNLMSR